MRRLILFGVAMVTALLLFSGCKKAYMVPTPRGWAEMEMDDKGNRIKIRPAEKVEVNYD